MEKYIRLNASDIKNIIADKFGVHESLVGIGQTEGFDFTEFDDDNNCSVIVTVDNAPNSDNVVNMNKGNNVPDTTYQKKEKYYKYAERANVFPKYGVTIESDDDTLFDSIFNGRASKDIVKFDEDDFGFINIYTYDTKDAATAAVIGFIGDLTNWNANKSISTVINITECGNDTVYEAKYVDAYDVEYTYKATIRPTKVCVIQQITEENENSVSVFNFDTYSEAAMFMATSYAKELNNIGSNEDFTIDDESTTMGTKYASIVWKSTSTGNTSSIIYDIGLANN